MNKCSTGLLTNDRNRQVLLRGRITKQTAACCVARLLVLASEGPRQPIDMHVDSRGGSIRESLMILSTMNGLKCPVRTFCWSAVGGSAVIIAAQGSPGLRIATPSARFSFKELHDEMSWISGQKEFIADLLAQRTERPVAEVSAWMSGGGVFTADQAVALHLIDAVAVPPLPV
jgi:ATP-dependent Clp protease, protease subunit